MSTYPILDDITVPDDVLENWQITVDLLAKIAGIPAALIMRVHALEIEVFVTSHSPGNVYHPGEKALLDTGLYCERVMSTQRKLLVPNAMKEPEWDHNPDIKLGMISYCGLPLTWPNGEIFGTICILDKKENYFNHRINTLMERFRDSIQLSLAGVYASSRARVEADEAKSALAASKNLSRRYLDSTQTMMVALDTKGGVIMINRAGQAILGYTEAELRGRNWFTTCLPQPEGLDTVYPMFRRIMTGEPEEFAGYENSVICRDGSRRLIGWRNSYFRDDEGRIIGTLSSGEDITERKRVEEALAESEKKYSDILATAPVGIFQRSMEGPYKYFNHALVEQFECRTEEEFVANYSDASQRWDDPEQLKEFNRQLLENKVVRDFSVKTRLRNGRIKWFSLFVTYDDATSSITGFCLDITRSKQDEQELEAYRLNLEAMVGERTAELEQALAAAEKVSDELHETNARLVNEIMQREQVERSLRITQFAVDHASDCLFWIKQDAGFANVNDSVCNRLGYSREELLGMTVFDVDPSFPRDTWASHWQEIKERRTFVIETMHRTKNGELFPVEATLNYVEYEGTEYNFAFTRDISERIRANEALKKARDAAEAANRAKSMFLANMSHEIRTPMNAVLGFAQLLERDPSLSPTARNKVATIMKSGEHLLSIINDILEMSRIEAGRVELRTEAIDLHRLLDDLAVMFRMRAEEKGLVFALECAPELTRYIATDLGKLRQVLINLLGNALKFTRTGSITLRALSAGNERVAIEVQDSGIGITPEEQTKLFHPFERTKSGEQAAGGTGLGLVISREYAHLLGGEITVASHTGEGSRFRFEFHAPPGTEVPVAAETARRVIAIAPGQGEIRVLVADDLNDNRELLRGMLEPLGFIVDEATDGVEVIEKVNALKPRIVLMDLVMPGMDGIEATRILRGSTMNGPLAIIGISASALEADKQRFLDAGINGFIAKPFQEQELCDVLAIHAEVTFETEEDIVVSEIRTDKAVPTLDKMPPEWREEFSKALTMKNITRIRRLGEAAEETDPVLSTWLLERIARYDLKGLMALDIHKINGAGYE